jgi:hypothetical protein
VKVKSLPARVRSVAQVIEKVAHNASVVQRNSGKIVSRATRIDVHPVCALAVCQSLQAPTKSRYVDLLGRGLDDGSVEHGANLPKPAAAAIGRAFRT